jgi:hypothetical protein
MNKLNLPQKLTWNHFFIAVEVIIAVLLSAVTFALVAPPYTVVNVWQLVLLGAFYLVLGWNVWFKHFAFPKFVSTITALGIFTLVLVIGFYSAQPAVKVREDAQRDTQTQKMAIQKGIDLGQKVIKQELTPDAAKQEITKQYGTDPVSEKLAQQALNDRTTDQTKPDTQIMTEKLPTIPVKLKEWTCVNIGCSYADDFRIWTLSTTNRVAGSLFVLVSMIIMISVVNQKPKSKK